MIPKVIHYVWLGGNPIPEQYQNFIDGWSEIMPDWEIKRWDESNFDIANSCNYCRQAYEQKRWAFVSDYIRLKVLYDNGGFYLDTDEQIIRPLDPFVNHRAVFAMESGLKLQACFFACEKANSDICEMVEYYKTINYIENNVQNNTVIGTHIANILRKKYPNFSLCEEIQKLDDGVVVYPSRFFCPDITGELRGPDTYTIHHYAGSWLSNGQTLKLKFNNFIGKKNAKRLSAIKQWIKALFRL